MTPTDSQAASLLREVLAECEGVGCYPCIGSHSPFEDLCGRIKACLDNTRPREDAGVADEWRPIETAPRDGRQMILLLTPSGWPQVAFSNTWWISGFSIECKPTHWIPIPPTPALAAAVGRANG